MLAPTPEGARLMRAVIGGSGLALLAAVILIHAVFGR